MTHSLVDVREVHPNITLDIRYATTTNFLGEAVYPGPHAYVHADVVPALRGVQEALEQCGLGLKLYDGFRPVSVQKRFWEFLPDERYVANPAKGSRHSRGTAVDVTIVDRTGAELLMPTLFDTFSEKAHRVCKDLPRKAITNRDLLEELMMKHGFIPFAYEWWHFDLQGWETYPVLTLSFSDLVCK